MLVVACCCVLFAVCRFFVVSDRCGYSLFVRCGLLSFLCDVIVWLLGCLMCLLCLIVFFVVCVLLIVVDGVR